MKKQRNDDLINSIGDAALVAKTGKNWTEWFAILDGAGATKLNHRQIVAYLREQHLTPDWWAAKVDSLLVL